MQRKHQQRIGRMMDLDTWINGHSLHVNVDIPKSEETLLVLNGAMEFFFFFYPRHNF